MPRRGSRRGLRRRGRGWASDDEKGGDGAEAALEPALFGQKPRRSAPAASEARSCCARERETEEKERKKKKTKK